MPPRPKPIAIFDLTPRQIGLIDKLAEAANGISMDDLEHPEIVAYQELSRLRLADMMVARRKIRIVITELGAQVRANGYRSTKPVLHLTAPQVAALRFLAGGRRGYNEIPGTMLDVCRRLMLRGWAEYEERQDGQYSAKITPAGWRLLKQVAATSLPSSP